MNESGLPQVTVVMINWRDNEWTNIARGSVENQYYPYVEFIEEDNRDNGRTIGKCWNDAVKKATSDYIVFLGDDDYISPDYIMSLVSHLLEMRKVRDDIIGVTSYITAFDVERKTKESLKFYPTGMFLKSFLLDNTFNEKLKKKVDTAFYEKLKDFKMATVYWNYGYFYRQHDGMTSGRCIKYKEQKKVKEYV